MPKHQDGDETHVNNTLFSCGSLAPKLKRGGGCMDHGFTRDKEDWELSDGSVFMLREMSKDEKLHEFVVSHLQNLISLSMVDHFKHSTSLKENLFKSLIQIMKNLGKKKFRAHVDDMLDPAFRNSKRLENMNMAIAAQDFILAMDDTYGQSIFKAIVESFDDRYLQDLDQYKKSAAQNKQQDFVYPAAKNAPVGFEMTKAPWAK